MSVEQPDLKEQIREYLYNHPFGKEEDEIQEEFDQTDPEQIQQALEDLTEQGELIEVNGKYRN